MWPHELKLQRAATHFDELEAETRRWEKGEGYSLDIQPDGDPPFYIARGEVTRPVEEDPFAFLLGDALQNARTALDYLAAALGDVGAGGVMSDEDAEATMFPIMPGKFSSRSFTKRAKRRLPTVSEPVRAVIEDLQPYKTGGDNWMFEPLWVLNELARYERHRFLQLGVVRAGGFRLNPDRSRNVNITDMNVEEGSYRLLEGIAAEEAAEDIAMGMTPEDGAKLASFTAVPFDPSEEMDMHFEGAFEITFDGDRLPPSLHMISGDPMTFWAVGRIVPDIEEVFKALAPFLPAEPPVW